jgi:hypothetical protein
MLHETMFVQGNQVGIRSQITEIEYNQSGGVTRF